MICIHEVIYSVFARSKIWIAVDLTVPVTTLTYKRIPAYWTVL